MSRGKWGWKARLAKIDEVCYAIANLDNMPEWDDLTLQEAIGIVKDVAELCDEDNGMWEYNPTAKRDYKKCIKWLNDFAI